MAKRKLIQINSVADKIKAEGQCRQCSCSEKSSGALKGRGVRELSRHRLVPGREGGEYVMANVIPLCRKCHNEVECQNPEARRRLRPKLWPMEVAHIIKYMGEEWFELMYPKPTAVSMNLREVDALFVRGEKYRPALGPRRPGLAAKGLPSLQGFGAKRIRRAAREKAAKAWDPDTIPGPSEKSLARQRASSTATTSKFA